MRARKSTLLLAGGWITTFVLYLFVKPDDLAQQEPPAPAAPALYQIPAAGVPGR